MVLHGMSLASGDGAGDEENDETVIAAYTRLAKVGAAAISKLDNSFGNLETIGANSDKANIDIRAKLGSIADITANAQGDSAIITSLNEFQTIMNGCNSVIEQYSSHQGGQNELVAQIIYPATLEAATLFSEITAGMKRLAALRKTLRSAESSKASAASSLAKLEASGKPDKGNKAHDLVSSTETLVDSLTQEAAVSVRVLCGFELNRVVVYLCQVVAKATIKFADKMAAKETTLSKAWMAAASNLDAGDPASTWKSTMVRLEIYGADLEDSWVKDFDPSDLDQSSNI